MGRIELALRAQPGSIAKLCVLKRMHAELRATEQEARFRREANIALQLSHPAIAQTIEVEKIDGELVLLQEFVHGVDLRLLATRLATACERVPLAVAIHIVSEIARALAYAHAFGDLGIVHRDVTPDNVMLAFSGEVKLIDFGIARSDADAMLTGAGHIVGRPTYTAPEIWEGAQADRRADIYSLGVVLWQLLTARRLEDAKAGSAHPPPAPSTHNVQVPPELDAVVARALASDPRERYQTAAELQAALRPFLPASFRAGPAVAALLGRHFDIQRERRMLAAEVERAMRVLPAAAAVPKKRSSGRAVLVAGIAAVGLALAVAAMTSKSNPRETAAPAPPRSAPAPSTPIVASPAPATVDPAGSAKLPVLAHAPVISAGRARPPGTRAARPLPPVPVDEVDGNPGRVPKPSRGDTRRAELAGSSRELLKRAQEKFDVGETEAALVLARQAASAGARAPAHVLMGNVMMSERRFDEAEREFAEAVRLDPGDAQAARLLALVREARGGGTP